MSAGEIDPPCGASRCCSPTGRLACRPVNFPPDHSLGRAYLRICRPPAAASLRSRRGWNAQWRDAGRAQGTLEVPAGHELQLLAGAWPDPGAYDRLRPGDVQALRLSGESAPHILGQVGHLAGLEALDLWGTPVGDGSMVSLPGLLGLRVLNLWGTRVTDAAIHYVAAIPGLRSLTVPGRTIGDAAMADLAAMARLRELDLSGSGVTDGGLATLGASRSISRLCLWGTAITDAGLANLVRFPALRDLDLGATAVTDAALVHLIGLGLHRLCLRDTLMSPGGVRQAREALGGCRVDPAGAEYCEGCRTPALSGRRRSRTPQAAIGRDVNALPHPGGSQALSDE